MNYNQQIIFGHMERHTYVFLDIWKDIYTQSWTYGKTLFWTYGKTHFLILKNIFL